jgi:hypothetical protein
MTPFGFRGFSGPFELFGPTIFSALGWALVVVAVLNVAVGVLLWLGRRRGAVLGLATTPVAVILGVGFALPFLLLPVVIRAAIVVAYRRVLL